MQNHILLLIQSTSICGPNLQGIQNHFNLTKKVVSREKIYICFNDPKIKNQVIHQQFEKSVNEVLKAS